MSGFTPTPRTDVMAQPEEVFAHPRADGSPFPCEGNGASGPTTGGGGTGPSTGGGGTDPCGGCSGETPHCMGTECVACLNHAHCTEPGAAKCDAATNTCVPCDPADPDVATQCAGVAEGAVCDAGTCVECTLGDEAACMDGQTCDLVAKACVDVAPESVGNLRGLHQRRAVRRGPSLHPPRLQREPPRLLLPEGA